MLLEESVDDDGVCYTLEHTQNINMSFQDINPQHRDQA